MTCLRILLRIYEKNQIQKSLNKKDFWLPEACPDDKKKYVFGA
jgi:hypothetical protein